MVQNNSKKIILITGATSGIGEATAEILSENYNLILCGRRENRLLEIQQTLTIIPSYLFPWKSFISIRNKI